MKQFIYVLPILLSSSLAAQNNTSSAEQSDRVTELKEVVVTGDNVWIEGEKIVFRPQKNEKNLATDAVSLIDRMNTGLLQVVDGKIMARGSQGVTIFINGVLADGMDLSTFWPKNAIRVEYMETSSDPRFMGKTNILNFVMKDYVAGGLTKINARQHFPNSGDYSASSKLVWGKMTYNAIFKGGYLRDHLSGSSETEAYRDIWYKGEHHDLITFEKDNDSYSRENELYAGFNARYRTAKTIISHNIMWQWNEDPGSGSDGEIRYMPEIISSDRMTTAARGRNISPAVSGNYQFIPDSKWSYGGNWALSHSHNNNFSSYTDLGLDPIITATKENYYLLGAGVYGQCMVRSNMQLALSLSEDRSYSDADYSGNTVSSQWQGIGKTGAKFSFWYRPVNNFSLHLMPELTLYDWNINHQVKKTDWMPGVNLRLVWNINQKHSMNGMVRYYQISPASSMRNDLILRQAELKWLQGNPGIESSDNYWFDINYFTSPLKWLNVSFSASYMIDNSSSAIIYRSGGPDYDGIIGEYINAGRRHAFKPQLDVSVSLLRGKLRLSNSLNYMYESYSNLSDLAHWRNRADIKWYFGNCSLSTFYSMGEKHFTNGGMGYKKSPDGYGLSFAYGNGNFNLGVGINNIFTKRRISKEYYFGDCYNSVGKLWSNGRNVRVSLTYTFEYGKKVSPGIDISEENIQSSSVLGSKK